MKTIIYPYTDFFVRYLLGAERNKDLLLSFINAVNENYDFPKINSVIIKNPFNLKNIKNDKESIIDVKATDENGYQYDIEVQVFGTELYKHRSLYYWARLYASQISSGDDYQKLKPTVCINLLNFPLIKNYDKAHSCFVLAEKNQPNLKLTNHLVLHYIELPKFMEEKKFKSPFERWLAFFKYSGQKEEIVKTILESDPIISKAYKQYKAFTQNDELTDVYEARMKWQSQYKTDIAFAKEEGLKTGIQTGKREGKREGKVDTAKKMLAKNFKIQDIADVTGLSIDKIKKFK